jgi:hypothetical protein
MYGREWVGRYQQKNVDLIHSILSFWCVVAVGVAVCGPISDYFLPLVNDSAFGPLLYLIGTLFTIFLFILPTFLICYKLLVLFEKWAIKEEEVRLEKESILRFIRIWPNLTKNKTEDEIKELMKEYEELSETKDSSWWVDHFHRRQKINKDN